jgi:hypothetical protein
MQGQSACRLYANGAVPSLRMNKARLLLWLRPPIFDRRPSISDTLTFGSFESFLASVVRVSIPFPRPLEPFSLPNGFITAARAAVRGNRHLGRLHFPSIIHHQSTHHSSRSSTDQDLSMTVSSDVYWSVYCAKSFEFQSTGIYPPT